MAHYAKLFESIIHSTLWQKDNHIKIVWITMLAMADSCGEVHASIPGLAKAAGVTINQCEEALACFLAPDPYSRSKEADGRRIEEIRGGWELINYRYYRNLKSAEQERENAAERQRRFRDRQKIVTVRNGESRESLQEEEEEDNRKRKDQNTTCPEPAKLVSEPPVYKIRCSGVGNQEYPIMQSQIDQWVKAFPGVSIHQEILKAQAWMDASPERRKTLRGMGRFFVGWFGRAQNAHRQPQGKPSRTAEADASFLEQLRELEREA